MRVCVLVCACMCVEMENPPKSDKTELITLTNRSTNYYVLDEIMYDKQVSKSLEFGDYRGLNSLFL